MEAREQDTSYNGWANYETWLVHLWLSNDQGSDEYWREAGREATKEAEDHPGFCGAKREPRGFLADRLKDELEEYAHEALPEAGVLTDLLGAALSEVDWYEVADAFLEE